MGEQRREHKPQGLAPAQYGGYSTEAQAQDEEGNSRGLCAAAGLLLGRQQRPPAWTWVQGELCGLPLSHHESAGLDKHVSSARAFRVPLVTAFIVQNGPVTPSRQASQWLGQSGLELMSLLDHPVFFFPSSPTLVSSQLGKHHFGNPQLSIVASFGLEARLTSCKASGVQSQGSKLHLEEVWICAPGLRGWEGVSGSPLSFRLNWSKFLLSVLFVGIVRFHVQRRGSDPQEKITKIKNHSVANQIVLSLGVLSAHSPIQYFQLSVRILETSFHVQLCGTVLRGTEENHSILKAQVHNRFLSLGGGSLLKKIIIFIEV